MRKKSALTFFLSILWGMFMALPGKSVTLLSDSVIADISAAAGETVSVFIEDERNGYIDNTFYYGDTDGIPGFPAGYIGYTFPTADFQSSGVEGYYNDFEYRFSTEEEAARFQTYLEENGYSNIRQRLIYSNASADTFLLDDGTAARVIRAFVITDKEVRPEVVRQFKGTIIGEPIVFGMRFPVIEKTTTVAEKNTWPGTRDREWTGTAHQYGKTGWPMKHYSAKDYTFVDHHYGKLTEYGAGVSDGPITASNGSVLVPANTVFLKSTLAPIALYSPEVAMSFSLVPPGGVPDATHSGG